jgi:hypothetical protein
VPAEAALGHDGRGKVALAMRVHLRCGSAVCFILKRSKMVVPRTLGGVGKRTKKSLPRFCGLPPRVPGIRNLKSLGIFPMAQHLPTLVWTSALQLPYPSQQ